MDFSTTEAADDLGGLVRTIADVGVHARAPARTRQARRALRPRAVVAS